MAGVSDKQLVTTVGWPAGVDNVSPETDLVRDDQGKAVIALRVADNVDLTAGGKPSRRAGYALVVSGGRVHSLWRDDLWPFAAVVIDGVLCGFAGGEDTFEIRAGLEPGLPVSYALAGERVHWSNGVQRGVVLADGTAAPWGCPAPGGQPTLTALATGGLDAGTYQVAVTWQLASGEESGAALAGTVAVPAGGGIALSEIRVPDDAAVAKVRVYVSQADGDVLYHAMDLAPGLPAAMIGKSRRGLPLVTQFLETMPAGQIVRWFNSRLYVAAGATLCWSESLRYGLTHPVDNRLPIVGGDIDLLEPVGSGTEAPGLYVASGHRTYWLGGTNPAQFTQRIAYPYGAVAGTGIVVLGNVFGLDSPAPVAYWMATNGVAVLGLPGGQVLPLRDQQVVGPQAKAGASLFRERGGLRQVVTALRDTAPNGLAMRDSGVMTVDRYDDTSLTETP
jgi:hypothetical protein